MPGKPARFIPGAIFGQLRVLSRRMSPYGVLQNRVTVECSCGNVIEVTTPALAAGKTDCGCSKRGAVVDDALNWTWKNIMDRNHDRVCSRWQDFNNFYTDMNPRPEGTKLSLKNKDGLYEPDNCFWEEI
jgi:hypothetical protein